jgi:hypothetical protein
MGSSASAYWASPEGQKRLREEQERSDRLRYEKLKSDLEFMRNYEDRKEKEQHDE